MESQGETVGRVLSHLEQIAAHLKEAAYWPEAEEYNKQVTRLESLGYDLDEYKVHFKTDVYPNDRTKVRPGHEWIVHNQVLDRRVKALLRFFELEEKIPVFNFPKRVESD